MQVHGQRIHGDHFGGFRAREFGEATRRTPVVTYPGAVRMKVSVNRIICPVRELVLDVLPRELRLQAK